MLSDASASSTVITNGDTSDHLLLMPHMVGNSAGAGGSLPLFALAVNDQVKFLVATHA